MWSIRRNHQHIKPETLTEYLDGRLGTGAMARADRELASCEACRDELDSLRTAVVMLRQLPMEAPRRSFTMVAPPPELVRARLSPPMRLPQWAFAGAASVAAIVLAVLVSADATGMLAPGGQLTSREADGQAMAVRVLESAVAKDQSLVADDGNPILELPAAAPAAAAPAATAAPAAEPSPAPLAMQLDAPPAAKPETGTAFAEPSPAPLARAAAAPVAAGEPVDTEVETELVAEPPPKAAAEALENGGQPTIESSAAASPPETGPGSLQEGMRVPAAGPESRELTVSEEEGTAAFWRVLEGLVAVAGALFLAGLVWKMTLSRRADRS
ncbi:MAG: hypothetical protein QGF39_14500 [Dehalococcoidia bacterium]|nr:hypothetical protein [Dehalococcoidia bacterium]